jgi:hypothetical protein
VISHSTFKDIQHILESKGQEHGVVSSDEDYNRLHTRDPSVGKRKFEFGSYPPFGKDSNQK